VRWLVALYPRGWRRRYGAELATLLDGQRFEPRAALDVLRGALDAHLHPELWRSTAVPSARLAEPGQRVLALARDEARRLHHDQLGTEHLVLALARDPDGIGQRILSAIGVDAAMVRAEALRVLGPASAPDAGGRCRAPGPRDRGELRVAPRLKRVLELAADEADGLHHVGISDAHLLLGLLREGEGCGVAILRAAGAQDLQIARDRVRDALADSPAP
jgi:ATP-dependent Clp protease ATP-binding subunit ClpC